MNLRANRVYGQWAFMKKRFQDAEVGIGNS